MYRRYNNIYNYLNLEVGEHVEGLVKSIQSYGVFVELENGKTGIAHIEDLSIARSKTPYERFQVGQKVKATVKSIDKNTNRFTLSLKENFGTWEENASKFQKGMKTCGIVRETDKNKNGIFIELTPNLVGMIEYKDGLQYGQNIDVMIKKIDYDKRKVKLISL